MVRRRRSSEERIGEGARFILVSERRGSGGTSVEEILFGHGRGLGGVLFGVECRDERKTVVRSVRSQDVGEVEL